MADAVSLSPATNNPQPDTLPWLRRAQIVDLGTRSSFTPYPEAGLRSYLANVGPVDNEYYVLNLLQRTQSTKIGPAALQLTLNALFDGLPDPVKDRIGLDLGARAEDRDTGPVIGQPDWFTQNEYAFDNTVDDFEDGSLPPLNSHNKEFIFWVVDAGTLMDQHYVTIVLHYEASNPSQPETLDRISHWAVVDSLDSDDNDSEAQVRTSDRIMRLFRKQHIDTATERTLWVPRQEEDAAFASGFLAYSVVSQLFDRVGLMLVLDTFDENFFFSPTRPWFNPDAVRAELLGRAAIKAMEATKWKTRLALFPVGQLQNGEPGNIDPEELTGLIPPILYSWPAEAYRLEQRVEIDAEADEDSPVLSCYLEGKKNVMENAQTQVQLAEECLSEVMAFAKRLQNEVLDAAGHNIPQQWAVERLSGLLHRARALHEGSQSLMIILDKTHDLALHELFLSRNVGTLHWLEEQSGRNSQTLEEAADIFLSATAALGENYHDDELRAEVPQGTVGRRRPREFEEELSEPDAKRRRMDSNGDDELFSESGRRIIDYKIVRKEGPGGQMCSYLMVPKNQVVIDAVTGKRKKSPSMLERP